MTAELLERRETSSSRGRESTAEANCLTSVLAAPRSSSLSDEALWSQLATSLERERAGLAAEGLGVHVPDLTGWALQGPHVLEAIIRAIIERVREVEG